MDKSVFIYGFGPYQEFETNITADIIERLGEEKQYACQVFDVVFDRAMFEAVLDSHRPRTILGLGQSRTGETLRIEQRARNVMRDAEICPIESSCEAEFLHLSWALPKMSFCSESEDAGDYVCNFSMWVVENWARRNKARFAFLHVPRTLASEIALSYIRKLDFA